MVRRTEAGISMVVVRTVVGVGLIGVPSVLGSGCEGSSKCDCETCESTGGTSASAGSANAESPEGGEATRPDGTGGQPSVGGASSSTEGGESGGATSTASGGSEHLDGTGGATSTSSGGHSWSPGGTGGGSTGGGDTGVSAGGSGTAERGGAGQSGVGSPATDGSATIDQALIGDECSDTLAVVCVAGMQRERAQCAASSGRWELYDACPDGTACAGPEASCTQTIVGCTEYTVDERYCAGDYELRQCDRYAESALVRFCEGHCIGGRCEDGPVPCAAAATPSTIDCACGCAAAGSQCEPSLNACDAASTFADLPKPVRFILDFARSRHMDAESCGILGCSSRREARVVSSIG